MKITRLESFLVNAGLRNYLFIRLTTDDGLTGIGEASLEWQEMTVQTVLHEWVEDRVLGTDPFDLEAVIGGMIRDQYQGGPTVMTAISGVEIACWDLIGKACAQPVYRLLGGQCHEFLPAYANGWYGNCETPKQYAEKARTVVERGYSGLKFDPFGTAWKEMSQEQMDQAEAVVEAVRYAVGDRMELMIEAHGRLSVACAIEMGLRLVPYRPAWYEEPVTPNSLDLLAEVKAALPYPIAAGERLYTLPDFFRLIQMRAADVVQMDPAHCGGLHISRKVAAMAEAQDMTVSPHCSIGPVALCAALHFDWATPNVQIQENFADFDVPWRDDLVHGWNPTANGMYILPDRPGLGLELNTEVCNAHPYRKNSFPSLWNSTWQTDFTQSTKS